MKEEINIADVYKSCSKLRNDPYFKVIVAWLHERKDVAEDAHDGTSDNNLHWRAQGIKVELKIILEVIENSVEFLEDMILKEKANKVLEEENTL